MRISDLVNKVEPFTFEYDGFTLSGEYYKFKTTTPAYAKAIVASVPNVPDDDASPEDKRRLLKERNEALEKLGAKALADTIKSWNATGDNDEPVPPTLEEIEKLPLPFTRKLLEFLNELRDGSEKKEPTASPSSS